MLPWVPPCACCCPPPQLPSDVKLRTIVDGEVKTLTVGEIFDGKKAR